MLVAADSGIFEPSIPRPRLANTSVMVRVVQAHRLWKLCFAAELNSRSTAGGGKLWPPGQRAPQEEHDIPEKEHLWVE